MTVLTPDQILDTIIEPADIILTASNSWLGRKIRVCEQAPGEIPSVVNHVGVSTRRAPVRLAELIEALWHVEEHSLMSEYGGKRDLVGVVGRRDITPAEKDLVIDTCRTHVGQHYGWWKIPAHGMDHVLSRLFRRDVYLFRKALWMGRRPICSWLPAEAFGKIGVSFLGLPVDRVQPDDIWDATTSGPEADRWIWRLPLVRIPKAATP